MSTTRREDIHTPLRLGTFARIVVLGLILLSVPVILAADVYVIPREVPTAIIYAIPVMIASRLFGRGITIATLLISLLALAMNAVIENLDVVRTMLSALSLLAIGILSLYWAEAESRLAELAAERSRLYEMERQRSQELEDSRSSLLDFFSMVAHDIKGPLTAIIGWSAMMAKWDSLDVKQREKVVEAASSSVKRMARLSDDLLDAARIGAGRFEIHETKWDIVRLVRDIVDERQVAAPGHHLVVDVEPEHMEGVWDEVRIAQAVNNLVDNAIKYSPEGSEVRVAVRRSDDRVKIAVSDQGIGIAREDIPLLFQPYSRLHKTSGIKGLGLGLYITKGIVEAHRGTIEVRSEFGKGSTFTIELPLEDP